MSIPLSEKRKKETFQKICALQLGIFIRMVILPSTFFCSHRNYVGVFITLLLLWILHLCIQCYVQEMSQIIMSKLNQLQIQIKYIHYAIIRVCVYVKVCILCLCRGFLTVVPAL